MDVSRKSALKNSEVQEEPEFKGWLMKCSRYLKLYRRRWFIVSNGLLTYYDSHEQMTRKCKGALRLDDAQIDSVSKVKFVISIPGRASLYLKASNENEKIRWIHAIELSKQNSMFRDQLGNEDWNVIARDSPSIYLQRRLELESLISLLNSKINDLDSERKDLEKSHQRSETLMKELVKYFERQKLSTKLFFDSADAINDFRIKAKSIIENFSEYAQYVKVHNDKWRRVLQNERETRVYLEDMLQHLAKDHITLENQARKLSTVSEFNDAFQDARDALYEDLVVYLPGKFPYKQSIMDDSMRSTSENSQFLELPKAIVRTKRDSRKSSVFIGQGQITELGKSEKSLLEKEDLSQILTSKICDIKPRPKSNISIWSIVKNSIGKDLSKIPMPVAFNEPISMLQRMTEDLEYYDLLDQAAKSKDSQQMAYVAAFVASNYSAPIERTTKPFNPMLGETFEFDRVKSFGWKSLSEQVSHHPPITAIHAEGSNWQFWQQYTMESKFKGKDIQILPLGISHLKFADGKHYTWTKIYTTVHNIIVGNLWIENHGEMDIIEHKNKISCHLSFPNYSVFSNDNFKVTGLVLDKDQTALWLLNGRLDEDLKCSRIKEMKDGKMVCDDNSIQTIWSRKDPSHILKDTYNFSDFTLKLNSPESDIAPTDTRWRNDIRCLEQAKLEESDSIKNKLEDCQRQRLKEYFDSEKGNKVWKPTWFELRSDPEADSQCYTFTGKYWQYKANKDWTTCPIIFPANVNTA
ncbi:unnamed protein product [Gordionus sp. m RMFG-2023]|uniref:oxysterol-binding protein 1-like n=1 Tax=Gordionus sp. m RMFG-2023 TaxID=3053472 RepID=UPI0030E3ADF3